MAYRAGGLHLHRLKKLLIASRFKNADREHDNVFNAGLVSVHSDLATRLNVLLINIFSLKVFG